MEVTTSCQEIQEMFCEKQANIKSLFIENHLHLF